MAGKRLNLVGSDGDGWVDETIEITKNITYGSPSNFFNLHQFNSRCLKTYLLLILPSKILVILHMSNDAVLEK